MPLIWVQYEQLHRNFANLMAIKDELNKANFGPQQPATFSQKQERLIMELSRPINFFDLCKGDLNKCISKISEFWSVYSRLFGQPVQPLQEHLRNTEYLKIDEVQFIKQANYVNDLARKLYNLLAENLLCRQARSSTAPVRFSFSKCRRQL